MEIIKGLGRGVLSALLKLSLFLLAMTAAFAFVFGTPDTLKGALADSGVYDTFVANSLDEAQAQQEQTVEHVPLDRPEIQAAAKAAFTPDLLKNMMEQLIDGTYGWLEGKNENPQFRIDLTAPKQNLINSLADYAVNRASSLPACNLQQLRELQGREIDPFNVSCLPPGLSVASIRQKVVTDLQNSDEFLKDQVLTESNLPRNKEGKTFFEQTKQAPEAFQAMKLAPYVFAVLATISAMCLILLHDDRRQGVRIVGFAFLTVGVIVFISTWLVAFAMNRAREPGGPITKLSDSGFEQAMIEFVTHVTGALNSKLYIFCATYVLLGVTVLTILKLKQRNT